MDMWLYTTVYEIVSIFQGKIQFFYERFMPHILNREPHFGANYYKFCSVLLAQRV
jgi:hypothetical protein